MPLHPADLRAAFRLPGLDGRAAQRALEPARRGPRPAGLEGRPLRDAAALAYVFERDGRLRLPLTVRRDDLPEHRGQVSLPGGRPSAGESLFETALREAEEEIGLVVASPVALGRLAPVAIPVTHRRLHVFVVEGPDPGPLTPDPREVAAIAVVGLDDLVAPATRRVRRMPIAGQDVDVPYFDVEGLFLWGATAMALAELVERLRRAGEGAAGRAAPDEVP